MTVQLRPTKPFSERLLLVGGGGAGKSETVLNIMSHCAFGEMRVVESDYSMSYDRALATDYEEIADRVHVMPTDPEWLNWIETLEAATAEGDPELDWLVSDSITPSWELVQQWTLFEMYGNEMVVLIRNLKKQYGEDATGFNKAKSDLMNWDMCKAEYGRVWKCFKKWKGHLIITAEAKALNKNDGNEEQLLYGPLGFKPDGEKRLKHAASTTLFLDHPHRTKWRITTVKDRNRVEVDKMTVNDFGIDYLQQIAGWAVVRKARLKAVEQ